MGAWVSSGRNGSVSGRTGNILPNGPTYEVRDMDGLDLREFSEWLRALLPFTDSKSETASRTAACC